MNEKLLQEQFPMELEFLPDQMFEEALMGVATRCNTAPVPAYNLQQCCHIAAADAWHRQRLSWLFSNLVTPPPLIVAPINKDVFWDSVRAGRLLVWEQLHQAIIGVGHRGGKQAVVYSRPLLQTEVSLLQEASYAELNPGIVDTILEAQIRKVWLGPSTPYILEPVLS
jgi:hypothetical protein